MKMILLHTTDIQVFKRSCVSNTKL